MTVHEVSQRTGLSVRTLQYYDRIGLLVPQTRTQSGYRIYTENDLETLQQIMLFRELEFPLKEIRRIIASPDFDREKALGQQIGLLELQKEHIENLIRLAREIREKGAKELKFDAFDKQKLDEYAKQAKDSWGKTEAYREYEKKAAGRNTDEEGSIAQGLMKIFTRFGAIRGQDPASGEAQKLVKELQGYITEHYYTCTNEILKGLGSMYAAGGEFTQNIDRAGGEGTAVFVDKAIRRHCE